MALSAGMSFVASLSYCLSFSVASASEGQVKVKAAEDVTLQCQDPGKAAIKVLEWTRPDLQLDRYVFFYRNNHSYESYQHPLYSGRVELRDESSMKDGDGSVILKTVTINDTGTYECRIIIGDTGSRARISSEFKHLVNMTVSDSGHTDEDPGGGGNKRGHVGLAVSLLFAGLIVVVLLKKYLEQPPNNCR